MSFRDLARQQGGGDAFPCGLLPSRQWPDKSQTKYGDETTKKSKATMMPSGLLYRNLKLVPSASSYESSCHDPSALELSSCSSSASSSPEPPSVSFKPPSSHTSSSPSKYNSSSGHGRGMPGFSTARIRHRINPKSGRHLTRYQGWPRLGSPISQRANLPLVRQGKAKRDIVYTTGVSNSSRKVCEPTGKAESRQNSKSKFSQLCNETKQFQRLVAQLENILEGSTDSPQLQLKCRTLISSSKEMASDLATNLPDFEQTMTRPEAKAGCVKLQRDFCRTQKALETCLEIYHRRQQADISRLVTETKAGEAVDQAQMLQAEQEDFFARAWKERDDEIRNINRSMHQVNEIYKDLAALVDGQQEQIDLVQESVQEAKESVDGGLRHIENARDGFCSRGSEEPFSVCGDGAVVDEDEFIVHRKRQQQTTKANAFDWAQSFRDNIESVKKSLIGEDNDLSSLRCALPVSICGNVTDRVTASIILEDD